MARVARGHERGCKAKGHSCSKQSGGSRRHGEKRTVRAEFERYEIFQWNGGTQQSGGTIGRQATVVEIQGQTEIQHLYSLLEELQYNHIYVDVLSCQLHNQLIFLCGDEVDLREPYRNLPHLLTSVGYILPCLVL